MKLTKTPKHQFYHITMCQKAVFILYHGFKNSSKAWILCFLKIFSKPLQFSLTRETDTKIGEAERKKNAQNPMT